MRLVGLALVMFAVVGRTETAAQVCLDHGEERPLFAIGEESASFPYPIPRAWMSGRSVGAPNAGILVGGARLPRSRLYECRNAETCVGSSRTVEALQRAIVRYRRRHERREVLKIGDLSREGGGVLRQHKSHQSGRDVDVAIPTRGGAAPDAEEIDWTALAHLVEALAEEGTVDAIFLDYELQAKMVEASESWRLRSLVQWRDGIGVERRSPKGLVRHAPGHERHIHVRFRCGEDEVDCQEKPIMVFHLE